MSKKRKNKGSGSQNSQYNATWFTRSVIRRRKRNVLAKLSRKFGRFTRGLMKKARKSYIRRQGFLAQGFIPKTSSTVLRGCKIRNARLAQTGRKMDGTMK